MRAEPVWAWFTGLAHTLPYDAAVCGQGPHLPTEALAAIDVPTLVLDGGESPAWMRAAAEAVAAAVPDGRYVTITGQDHGVLHHPAALLPALGEFLS
jgi:pimeloyl-ACP methyl ester carboxylesterase